MSKLNHESSSMQTKAVYDTELNENSVTRLIFQYFDQLQQ